MRKDNKLINVLQVNASTKGHGGVSEIVFNIYKHIDKTKVRFDFLSPNKTTYEVYREQIEKFGGDLYGLNVNSNKIINKLLIWKRLNEFLKDKTYDVIHINSGSFFFNLQIAMIAKKNNIEKIIVHSHNSKNKKNFLKNMVIGLSKPLMNFYATDFLACSEKAAESMFTKKVAKNKAIIVKNGIELEKFKFNDEVRKRVREELKINEKLVLGNVGRFVEQKRQDFVIDCFYELHNINPESVLILIGTGELEEKLRKKVSELQLDENVKFLGFRKDVNEILQAMDVFIFPSAYEGFGIVGLESQTAGVLTVVSDVVPQELKVTDNIVYLDFNRGPQYWANTIINANRQYNREDSYNQVVNNGYSIEDTAKQILNIYQK